MFMRHVSLGGRNRGFGQKGLMAPDYAPGARLDELDMELFQHSSFRGEQDKARLAKLKARFEQYVSKDGLTTEMRLVSTPEVLWVEHLFKTDRLNVKGFKEDTLDLILASWMAYDSVVDAVNKIKKQLGYDEEGRLDPQNAQASMTEHEQEELYHRAMLLVTQAARLVGRMDALAHAKRLHLVSATRSAATVNKRERNQRCFDYIKSLLANSQKQQAFVKLSNLADYLIDLPELPEEISAILEGNCDWMMQTGSGMKITKDRFVKFLSYQANKDLMQGGTGLAPFLFKSPAPCEQTANPQSNPAPDQVQSASADQNPANPSA